MKTVLELTVCGSVACGVVWALDAAFSRRVLPRWRRLWWLIIPLAFLCPLRLPLLPPRAVEPGTPSVALTAPGAPASPQVAPAIGAAQPRWPLWMLLWGTGAAAFLLHAVGQSLRVSRHWAAHRLSTDSGLLSLLEACKERAGVTAPIGVVVAEGLSSPALLGWLRPRILLPAHLVQTLPPEQLRAVFLHELAHFRSWDIPAGWLFTAVRVVHWFNPLAYAAFFGWCRFREEAADATALGWLEANPAIYPKTLLSVLRHTHTRPSLPAPAGALAIGESFHRIKQRILMIQNHPTRREHLLLALALCAPLLAGTLLRPAHAESPMAAAEETAKSEALAAMASWLKTIDEGHYAESWKAASSSFRAAVTEAQWIAALGGVRTPLGKCEGREAPSFLHQRQVPTPSGKMQDGDFAIFQFESSYQNLKRARETVTFEKEKDGQWRAAGYYIRPD